MYNVSAEYLAAVRSLSRTDRVTGTLELTNGTIIEIKDNRVFERTLELVHDIVTGEEIEFGTVMLKQLSFSLRTHQDRYVFYDAKITPYYGVKIGEDTWFDIPLGVYHVAEAERGGSYVQLVAYDDLRKFDIDYDGTAMTGTDFEVLSYICEMCGVPLGMTEDELASFPNSGTMVHIDSKTGCNTYRDCLKVIAQKLASFVTTNRTGELILRRYSSAVSGTLEMKNRFKTTLADYVCRYAAVTVIAGENKYSSFDTTTEAGLELIIQDAPAWEYGTEENLQAQTDALMAELSKLPYTPSKLTISNDPAIDCGDMLAIETESGTVNTLVTGFTWRYRARMQIDSAGKNPYLKSVKPQKGQIIRELEKQTEYNKLIFYSFTNKSKLVISGTEVEALANVTFVTVEDTSAMFLAQLPVTIEIPDVVTETEEEKTVTVKNSTGAETTILDTEGNPLTLTVLAKNTDTKPGTVDVEVFYYLDGSLVDYTLIERLTNGPHILSLFYPFSGLKGNQNHTWDVRIRAQTGSVTVEKNALKATVTGQGLAATTVWDGTITVEEVWTERDYTYLGFNVAEETASIFHTPDVAAISEIVGDAFSFAYLSFGASTVVEAVPTIKQNTIDPVVSSALVDWVYEDRYVEVGENGVQLKTAWNYESAEQAIDSGRMTAVKAVTADLESVESVEVTYT